MKRQARILRLGASSLNSRLRACEIHGKNVGGQSTPESMRRRGSQPCERSIEMRQSSASAIASMRGRNHPGRKRRPAESWRTIAASAATSRVHCAEPRVNRRRWRGENRNIETKSAWRESACGAPSTTLNNSRQRARQERVISYRKRICSSPALSTSAK